MIHDEPYVISRGHKALPWSRSCFRWSRNWRASLLDWPGQADGLDDRETSSSTPGTGLIENPDQAGRCPKSEGPIVLPIPEKRWGNQVQRRRPAPGIIA